TNLTAADFEVLPDGEERPVESAEVLASLPIHVAVAMDTSSSMGTRVRTASASAQRFFESLLTPKDRASLISFNHDLNRRVAFTNDVEVLRYGALGARAYGATRLWDALVYSISSFASQPDRRALVLLSDGADTDSDFLFEQVLDAALRARVMIFPITLARLDEETSADLETLARETGGVSFEARDVGDLDRIYRRIEELLRSQYLIVYRRPPGARSFAASGEVSPIEVRIRRPGLIAHSVRRKL
ncbi:MAG: VWA domain-containing protein, partial [Acidobacteria bacterium]|nr:VWA domain-containing protein [Acidobacteriota bacterium]